MNARSEEALLAALINSSGDTVLKNPIPLDAFGDPALGSVYAAVREVAKTRDAVTQLLVHREMQRQGLPGDRITHVLARLADASPSFAPGVDAQEIIRVHHDRVMREGLLAASRHLEQGRREEARKLVDDALAFAAPRENEIKVWTPPELAALYHAQDDNGGMPLNVPMIANAITRLIPGSMTVIGGQTGAYKSSLSLFIAQTLERDGQTPGVVSLEDPPEIWGERCEMQWSTALPDARMPVVCLDTHRMHLVTEAMRVLVYRHHVNALLVDYVQLITRDDMRGIKRAEVVSAIARDLKTEAKRLRVPLILVSQLSRPEKGARWKEPTVFDLKETGDLENNAENIILLWKTGDDDDSQVFGKVGKVKNSPLRPRFELVRGRSGVLLPPQPKHSTVRTGVNPLPDYPERRA